MTPPPSNNGRDYELPIQVAPIVEIDVAPDLTTEQRGWPVGGFTQPVTVLPVMEFDMANPADSAAPSPSSPAIVLTLSASNGHDPAVLSDDLNQLRVAVRQYAAKQGPAEAVTDALKRCLEDGIKLSVE
jgi:hypothetical protein